MGLSWRDAFEKEICWVLPSVNPNLRRFAPGNHLKMVTMQWSSITKWPSPTRSR